MKNLLSVIAVSLAALVPQCGSLTGGGGSEGHGITGVIVNKSGDPAANTLVTLIPADYNPGADSPAGKLLYDTTNGDGEYSFATARAVLFNIEAVQLADRTRLFVQGIEVSGDRTVVPEAVLERPGLIRLSLPSYANSDNGYAYIPGTTVLARFSDNIGSVLIDSVPAGLLPSINYGETGSPLTRTIRTPVMVVPGYTEEVFLPDWQFSRPITLNTSPSGADVSGTIVRFPVCLRLSSGTIDFAVAQQNGRDLRFSNSKGGALAYEIESWDKTLGQAVVWVCVDTVYGNNADQFILMYWGNPAAGDASDGAAVFDTAEGFQGVWHLAQQSGLPALDATGNRFNGTPSVTAPVKAAGVIGTAQAFSGTLCNFEMAGTATGRLDFPKDGTYMICAWATLDTLSTRSQVIVAKDIYQYSLHVGTYNYWQFNEYRDAAGWETTWASAEARKWTFLVGIRSGASQYLYVNGVLVDNSIEILTQGTAPRSTVENVRIGQIVLPTGWGTNAFSGKIDEVRILNTARDAGWIKLCYMNQRVDDQLVEFRSTR